MTMESAMLLNNIAIERMAAKLYDQAVENQRQALCRLGLNFAPSFVRTLGSKPCINTTTTNTAFLSGTRNRESVAKDSKDDQNSVQIERNCTQQCCSGYLVRPLNLFENHDEPKNHEVCLYACALYFDVYPWCSDFDYAEENAVRLLAVHGSTSSIMITVILYNMGLALTLLTSEQSTVDCPRCTRDLSSESRWTTSLQLYSMALDILRRCPEIQIPTLIPMALINNMAHLHDSFLDRDNARLCITALCKILCWSDKAARRHKYQSDFDFFRLTVTLYANGNVPAPAA